MKKDFWLCHNNWIVKHDGCEKIAKIENISFDPPTANMDISPSICLLIKGFKVDVKTDSVVQSEWSFGEANANNTRMPYWWAMAEKRGKDRVILKMIGAYEKGLYSEVEADEWKQQFKDNDNQAPNYHMLGLEPRQLKIEHRKRLEIEYCHQISLIIA